MSDLDQILTALADPSRRRVVDLLRQKPRRAGDLATRLRMSPPALSRHLRILRRSGLIEEERVEEDARVRLYRLRQKPFRDLNRWLSDVEAIWDRQLDAFKQHVEMKNARKIGTRKS